MGWEIYVVTTMLASLIVAVETVYAMAYHHGVRTWGLLTVFGVVAFPVAVILHNVASAAIEREETVSFIIGVFVAPAAITIGALGTAVALRFRAPVAAAGFGLAGMGLVLLPAYVAFAFVASTFGDAPRSAALVEQLLLPASLTTVTVGVIAAAFGLAAQDRRIAA